MIKTLKRLGAYMGGRKWLLPCSVGLSAVHGLLALVPFVLLWLVVRTPRANATVELCPGGFRGVGGRRGALFCGAHVFTLGGLPCGNQHAALRHGADHAGAVGLLRHPKHGADAQNH